MIPQETKKMLSTIIVRLRQGKKREIRRIMYRCKLKLLTLKRIRFAELSLGNLSENHYRALTDKEVKTLNG